MNRKCPVTLDRPVFIFGLEMEDIALLGSMIGIGSLLVGPFIPGVLGIAGWVVLVYFKRGRPCGYLLHWLYEKGVELPGIILPIKKCSRYGVYGSVDTKKKIKVH